MRSFKHFYRFIHKFEGKYDIIKDNEKYGRYNSLEDALYERDRLIAVDWDWDKSLELPEYPNNYIHIDLPPFVHQPNYISVDAEHWVVRDKGKSQKYRGRFDNLEDAKKMALIYNANISHRTKGYRVQRRINGRTRYFGRYQTLEEAEERVRELEKQGWGMKNANSS